MEDLRAPIADRLVLSLINRNQVRRKSFDQLVEGGEVRLTDAARKTVLKAYQERKAQELRHPFLKENMTLGMVPHIQARLLARYLRGDLDAYPPFIWR
jgi:CRISPR-associated protein Cas1